jgi:hypothetical protein
MQFLKHLFCTKVLPPDPGTEHFVDPLPVCEDIDPDSGTWTHSFWKPSAEDLKILNEGGCICLQVMATDEKHPAVGMVVGKTLIE